MKKQTMIVTGTLSGIGKEVTRHFLANGDNVVINSLTAKELGASKNLAMVAGHQTAGLHFLNQVEKMEDTAQMVNTFAKSNFITGAIINLDDGLGAGRNLV